MCNDVAHLTVIMTEAAHCPKKVGHSEYRPTLQDENICRIQFSGLVQIGQIPELNKEKFEFLCIVLTIKSFVFYLTISGILVQRISLIAKFSFRR